MAMMEGARERERERERESVCVCVGGGGGWEGGGGGEGGWCNKTTLFHINKRFLPLLENG